MELAALIALGLSVAVGGAVAAFDRYNSKPKGEPPPPPVDRNPYRRPDTPSSPQDPESGGWPTPPPFDD